MPKKKEIPAAVKKVLQGSGIQIPQIAELVSHFMAIAGGPQMVAKMMMEEFLGAKQGSIIRQRILDSVLRLLTIAGQQYNPVSDVDLLASEDLERELAGLIQEVPDDGQEEVHPAEGLPGEAQEGPAS